MGFAYNDVWFGPGSNYLQRTEVWWTGYEVSNYSDVRIKTSMYSNGSYSMYTTATKNGTQYWWNINRGSEQQSNSLTRNGVSTPGSTWVTLGDSTKRINHNDDGSCLLQVHVDFNYDVTINGVYCGQIVNDWQMWCDQLYNGRIWINQSGTWNHGTIWVNQSGTWKQGQIWVNQSGTFHKGI